MNTLPARPPGACRCGAPKTPTGTCTHCDQPPVPPTARHDRTTCPHCARDALYCTACGRYCGTYPAAVTHATRCREAEKRTWRTT